MTAIMTDEMIKEIEQISKTQAEALIDSYTRRIGAPMECSVWFEQMIQDTIYVVSEAMVIKYLEENKKC